MKKITFVLFFGLIALFSVNILAANGKPVTLNLKANEIGYVTVQASVEPVEAEYLKTQNNLVEIFFRNFQILESDSDLATNTVLFNLKNGFSVLSSGDLNIRSCNNAILTIAAPKVIQYSVGCLQEAPEIVGYECLD